MTCAPVINGIYLLNYLWLKNQEVPEKIPKETGEYKKEKNSSYFASGSIKGR